MRPSAVCAEGAGAASASLPEASASPSELKTVRVGYFESRNFTQGAESDVKSGYGYEYLQHVAGYAGWRFEYVYGTWDELYQKLCAGEIDLLPAVSKTAEHEEQVLFPQEAMLNETFYIYAPADDGSVARGDLSTFAGKRVGVVDHTNSSTVFDSWLASTGADLAVERYGSYAQMHEAFEADDIDLFVSSDNKAFGAGDVAPMEIVGTEPYYLAVAPGESDLLAELDSMLTIIYAQDRVFLDELQNRYAADSAVNVFLTPEEAAWISAHQTLKVGYLKEYLPYCASDGAGSATGLFTDVLGALLDGLPGGWEPDIDYRGYASQAELIDALTAGKVDVIFPVGGETWYAEKIGVSCSAPVATTSMDAVARAGEDFSQATQRVAVNRNNLMQRLYVEDCFDGAEILEFDSIDACLEAVKDGAAGCTVVNGLRSSALLKSETSLYTTRLPQTDARCFGVLEGNGVLLRFLNRGLGRLGESYGSNAASDYMAGLYRYTALDYVRDNLPAIVTMALASLCCIVAAGVDHVHKLRREAEREMEQNQRLEDALAAAERANRAKDLLLTNLSHDIRTPLNGILGALDINASCDDPQTVFENARKAHTASRQLLGLVDDLLEMSKLRSGDVAVEPEEFLLASVFDNVLAEMRPEAEEAGVSIKFVCHCVGFGTTWVSGSPVYVRQVLVNILDNAVRYNRAGGSVRWEAGLTGSPDGGAVLTCSIKDDGPGIDEDLLKRVFEPFQQAETSEPRSEYRGSGLGLPIAHELVSLMGGTIDIQNAAEGGAEVVVAIPFAQAEVREEGSALAAPGASVEGMRFLVAEDNELNREIMTYVLTRAGAAEVIGARDGAEAVARFEAAPVGSIDAVLMDVMMPVMDGCEAARAIRALGRADAREVPIIAVTARAFADDRAEILASGMNEHLAKPLDTELLIQILAGYRS